MNPPSVTAYIALGANLGDRQANIDSALHALAETPTLAVVRVSSFIETAAVGGPEGSPDYLNAVAEIRTSLTPLHLLNRLMDIEHSMGRVRRQRWEPRLIDLDILLFGDQVIVTDNLAVPHPLLHTRRFVLQPLSQIAPHLIHPTLHRTIESLLIELPQ